MTIADVSKEFDISTDTLRYYERIGLIPPVTRTKGGIRNYSENDIRSVKFIKCMRTAGVSIEALIEYISLFSKGDETVAARKSILVREREKIIVRISEMQDALNRLNYKIENYENIMKPLEESLN